MARPRRRPGRPSPPSAAAAGTRAGCGPMARWPAGGRTPIATVPLPGNRPHPRTKHSLPSAAGVTTLAGYGVMVPSDAGGGDPSVPVPLRARHSGRSATIRTGIRAGCVTTAPLPVGGLNNRGQASPPSGVSFTAITSGDVHTCGLQPSGAVACWGSNHKWSGSPYYGQATPPQDQTFVAISAGYNHVCGITTAEAVVCWGDDTYGQSTPPAELSSNTLSSTAPDLVVRSASLSVRSVKAGGSFTFSTTVHN